MGLGARFGLSRYEAEEKYRAALMAYEKKNLEEAINQINDVIELLPSRAEYHAARGLFRLSDGLVDEAEADFDAALQRSAYEVLANFGKGKIFFDREAYQDALTHFQAAWAADETRAETLYCLALTEHRLQHHYEALDWMQQAVEQFDTLSKRDKTAARRKRMAQRWVTEFEKIVAFLEAHPEGPAHDEAQSPAIS